MSTNLNPLIINPGPYLRTSRDLPEDPHQLSVELERTYIDIAGKVNDRTIGIFATNRPSVDGNKWYTAGQQPYQELRQVYLVTGTGNIAHGINTSNIAGFVRIYGTFTDGSIWYPLPYVNATAANNQVSVTVTSTNIVITAGGGSPPTISSGFVVLEWISQP
jgi:hypothetical protein